MTKKNIRIIDYGLGNLFSIERAIRHLGGITEITGDPRRIASADRLILPGVGAFSRGMHELNTTGIADAIREFIERDRPLLGICLGMQFLFTRSQEFGVHEGLNLIGGEVIRLRLSDNGGPRIKIPHVGWAGIEPPQIPGEGKPGKLSKPDPILRGIDRDSSFYFVHSYFVVPDNRSDVLAESKYGPNRFCSMTRKDNLIGCQFHPEKSGPIGLRLLKNFTRS